jgi:hypothetical protein
MGLLICVLVMIVFGIWHLGREWKEGWNGLNRASLLVVEAKEGGRVALINFDPYYGRVSWLNIPSETIIPVLHGYGDYRIGVVQKLGKQEKLGDNLLRDSLEQWWGVRIVGVLTIKEGEWQKWGVIRNKWLMSWGNGLKLTDGWKWWWWTRRVDQSDVEVVDLQQEGFVSTELQPDRSIRYRMGDNMLEKLRTKWLTDEVVKRQGKGVRILNGTKHKGLANELAKELAGVGFDVVGVDDKNQEVAKSELLFDQELPNSSIMKWLLYDLVSTEPKLKAGVEQEYRSQVVIVLGEDYFERKYGKSEIKY